MVHDPRVTSALARLGGVYRDPSRVDRDAASLLKSSVGEHLVPITAEMFENNGSTSTVLVLQGTIAMHFRGNTYQLLIDLYLPIGYPQRPPIAFVRLAPNMYLKENHRHVGSDGKVYLPYLHEWRMGTHNLIELVVAMSSVFSNDPPVFSRRPGTTTTTTSASPPATASGTNSSNNTTSTTTTTGPSTAAAEAMGGVLSDEEAIAAVVAQQALEAEEAAREEMRQQEAREEQRRWEERRTTQVRQQVAEKLQKHLMEQRSLAQHTMQEDLKNQERLNIAKSKIEGQVKDLTQRKAYLQEQLQIAEKATQDIQEFIKVASESKDDQKSLSVDEKVQPATPVHAQMMELSAENAAISDALYFLDRALYQGHLNCAQHLKQVRSLAKRQFLVRAHLMKIHQTLVKSMASAR